MNLATTDRTTTPGLTLEDQLQACRERVARVCAGLPSHRPAFTVIFSFTDGTHRAQVVHGCADSFEQAWREGADQLRQRVRRAATRAGWLRVDWVEGLTPVRWAWFEARLAGVKRNYFRLGLALDLDMRRVLTGEELNANAMLYAGPQVPHAAFNKNNFEIYLSRRFPNDASADFASTHRVGLLTTSAVFCGTDGVVHQLAGPGLDAGRRQLPPLTAASTVPLIASGARYLARQIQDDGRFIYGRFPCFDRRIPSYNTLRHASTLYAMLEAWEVTREPRLLAAIERGLDCLSRELIRSRLLPDGTEAAFLVDVGNEIKLGGNAVCLLALVKHSELTGTRQWLPLLEKLALGIGYMQEPASGRFNHVLHAQDLTVKQASRIIYYDGEAAFGLMCLYGLTRDKRWLTMVERAFEHFIASQHWQAHDHWLSYCVNELTRWRPQEKYFRFGVRNVSSHLDFVLNRKTTFPTLLELMVAAQRMLERLATMPALRHLLYEIDVDKFERALHFRANYLLNGYFWPEQAMYFRDPRSIVGSFFIRHHAFRVRIDDVEHYLSGLVGYHQLLKAREAAAGREQGPAGVTAQWSAAQLAQATGGQWLDTPPARWRVRGVSPRPLSDGPHVLCVEDHHGRGGRDASTSPLHWLLRPPAAILCSDPTPHLKRGVPILRVASVRDAMASLALHARARFDGRVVAVAGAGHTSEAAELLAQALGGWGPVARPSANASTPAGLAWSMSCMSRHAGTWLVELGLAPARSAMQLLRPDAVLLRRGPDDKRVPGWLLQPPPWRTRVVLDADSASHGADAAWLDSHGIVHFSFGKHPGADVRLTGLHHGQLQVQVRGETLCLRLRAVGRAVALHACAAFATLLALELPPRAATQLLRDFMPHAGRATFHTVTTGAGVFHLIDQTYDANPASMRAALDLLAQAPCAPSQRVAILGDMQDPGPAARGHHAALAEALLAARPDRVLLCGPLMKALYQGIRDRVRSRWFADVDALAHALDEFVRPGDWVLAKASRPIGLGRLTRALKALS